MIKKKKKNGRNTLWRNEEQTRCKETNSEKIVPGPDFGEDKPTRKH